MDNQYDRCSNLIFSYLFQPGGKFCPVYIGEITPEFFLRLHPWRGVTFSLLCVYIFFIVPLQKISGYVLP